MTDEPRKNDHHEEPEVFAVSKGPDQDWQFSRRDFMKAAGAAAAAGALAGQAQGAQAGPAQQESVSGFAHTGWVTGIDFSPDGQYALTGASFGEPFDLKLWRLPDGALLKTFEGHGRGVFYAGGTRLATSLGEKNIDLWSLPESELLATLPTDESCTIITIFDQTLVTWQPSGLVMLWSLETLSLERSFESIRRVAVSADGALLGLITEDDGIEVWSLQDDQRLHELSSSARRLKTISFSPDSTLLVTGGEDRLITVWSLADGEPVVTLEDSGPVWQVTLAPDGSLMVSSNGGFWRLPDGAPLESPVQGDVNAIVFSEDSTLLALAVAAGGEHTLVVISLPENQVVHTLAGHLDQVFALAISPDKSLLISGSGDKTARVWSLMTGELLFFLVDIAVSLPDFEGIQYSPGDSGEGVITLPAGSELPAGVTCICNTVQGSGCSCVGHRSSGGSHYWYPN